MESSSTTKDSLPSNSSRTCIKNEVQTTSSSNCQFPSTKSPSNGGAETSEELIGSADQNVQRRKGVKTSMEYFIERYLRIGDDIGVCGLERWVNECPSKKRK